VSRNLLHLLELADFGADTASTIACL